MAPIERDVKARFEVDTVGDKDAFKKAADDAKDLKDAAGKASPTLDETRAKLAKLRETLQDAFKKHGIGEVSKELERAKTEVGDFLDQVEEGAGGVEEVATRARLALSRLQEAQTAQARQGRRVTREQRKEIEGLEDAYKKAIRGAGRFRRAQIEATREIEVQARKSGELQGSVSSLGDIFSLTGSKSAAMAIKIGAAAGAFSAGFEAGNKFREGLAAIDRELNTNLLSSLDNFIQKSLGVEAAINRLFQRPDQARRNAEELANINKILAKNGLEAAKTLDEGRVRIEKFFKSLSEARGGLKKTAEGFQEWAQSIGLSLIELDKGSKELVKFVEILRENNKEINNTQLGEALKSQVQGLLDGYQTLGQEVPKALQQIADSLGILDSKSEESFEKQQKFAEQYRKKLNDILGVLPEDIQTRAAAILQEIEKLSFEEINILPVDTKDKLAEQLKEWITVLQAARVPISDEIRAIAGAVGVVVPSFEPVEDAAKKTGKALEEVSQGGKKVAQDLPEATPKVDDLSKSAATLALNLGKVQQSIAQLTAQKVGAFLAPVRSELDSTNQKVLELLGNLEKVRDFKGAS